MSKPQVNCVISFSTLREYDIALYQEVQRLRTERKHFNLGSWLKEAIAEKLEREKQEQK